MLIVFRNSNKTSSNRGCAIDESVQMAASERQPFHLFNIFLTRRAVGIEIWIATLVGENDKIRPDLERSHARGATPISVSLHSRTAHSACLHSSKLIL